MFKVSARTILELGSELISSDIIAFYELIKNSFDAQTKNGVKIEFDITLQRNEFKKIDGIIQKENITLEAAIELITTSLDKNSIYHKEYLDFINHSST